MPSLSFRLMSSSTMSGFQAKYGAERAERIFSLASDRQIAFVIDHLNQAFPDDGVIVDDEIFRLTPACSGEFSRCFGLQFCRHGCLSAIS